MAPYPEEIDVFSVPHSRMKQLVDVYCKKLTCTDFTDYAALESLLHDLHQTFCEFKSHEQIENQYIMKKLKKRLKAMSIHDASVCNCHSDNRLSDILALVEDGYSCTSKTEAERINFGIKLRNALQEFTGVFLPHMKEEEEVFQPMLIKYFEYEELKCLKEQVIEEHDKFRAYDCDREKVSLEEEESDLKVDISECDRSKSSFQLPPEVMSHIFSFLTPHELLRCSQVSRTWYEVSHNPALWKEIYPCHWAHGIWDTQDVDSEDLLEAFHSSVSHSNDCYDEDADFDESGDSDADVSEDSDETDERKKIFNREVKALSALVKYLLPAVGTGVQKIVLASCKGLTSTLLRSILRLCPNVVYLDLSYTSINDSAFKGLKDTLSCAHLQHLDLSGCMGITDLGLFRLADCMAVLPPYLPNCKEELCSVYLEDCDRLFSACGIGANEANCCCEIEDSGYLLQRRAALCSECQVDRFCAAVCAWKKGGVMCHVARLSEQCPYVNKYRESDSQDVLLSTYSAIRTNNSALERAGCEGQGSFVSGYTDVTVRAVSALKFLSLSGCWEVTDEGLRCLAEAGLLTHLEYLDVSGCSYLSGAGLCEFISMAPSLLPENFYYCSEIEDGPYSESANGCQNLENDYRPCCRNRVF